VKTRPAAPSWADFIAAMVEFRVFGTHTHQRLTKDDSRVDGEMRLFLSRTYNLKAIADYETGPGSDVSAERAVAAADAGRLSVCRGALADFQHPARPPFAALPSSVVFMLNAHDACSQDLVA